MGKKYLFYLLLQVSLLSVDKCMCQSTELRVYNAYGPVIIVKEGKQDAARRGTAVNSASLLKLAGPASVILIDSSGLYTKVDKPGNYTYTSLLERIKQLSRYGVSSRFFKYVYNTLIEGHGSGEEGNHIIAGVFRGQVPMKLPPDSSVISTDTTLLFQWVKERPKLPFRFILKDGVTKKVIIDSVLKKELSLTLDTRGWKTGQVYEWSIDENNTGKPHLLFFTFILSKPQDSSIIKEEKNFINSIKPDRNLRKALLDDLFRKWLSIYKSQKP